MLVAVVAAALFEGWVGRAAEASDDPARGVAWAEVYGANLPADRVLPISGADLPPIDAAGGNSRAYALAPQVQAIPTPSAAVAGLVGLATLVIGRALVRRRSAV